MSELDKAIVKISIEHFEETIKDRGENIEFNKDAFYKLLDSMKNVLAELDKKDTRIEKLETALIDEDRKHKEEMQKLADSDLTSVYMKGFEDGKDKIKAELKDKDKQIELMAEKIAGLQYYNSGRCQNEKDIIKEFENKAKENKYENNI